jgi:transcriptional regulator with XRE-family HTH domain
VSQFLTRNLRVLKAAKDVNVSDLANELGVSDAVMKNYMAGRTPIPMKHINTLAEYFGVSINSLLSDSIDIKKLNIFTLHKADRTGPGDKANPPKEYYFSDKQGINDLVNDNEMNVGLIPFYDVQAMASTLEVFSDQTTVPSYKMDIPGFSDCDFAISVYGHSMYPTFESGTIIICKRIIHKEFIQYGECYFLVTNEYRMLKRLLKADRSGWVVAASDNHNGHSSPDGKTYGSQEIALKDILFLYLVKGSIKRHHV